MRKEDNSGNPQRRRNRLYWLKTSREKKSRLLPASTNPRPNTTEQPKAGNYAGIRKSPPDSRFVLQSHWRQSELNNNDCGQAGGVRVASRCSEADVVNLWPESQLRERREAHAAAEAPCELIAGTAATAKRHAGATHQSLREGRYLAWVTQGKARPEKASVSIQRYASRRSMVSAEIADQSEPFVGEVGDGAAAAVLIDSPRTAKAEVGVANGSVYGLGARRNSEEKEP